MSNIHITVTVHLMCISCFTLNFHRILQYLATDFMQYYLVKTSAIQYDAILLQQLLKLSHERPLQRTLRYQCRIQSTCHQSQVQFHRLHRDYAADTCTQPRHRLLSEISHCFGFLWSITRLSFFGNSPLPRHRRSWHAPLRLCSAICRHHPP